jgi:hypothetical protein
MDLIRTPFGFQFTAAEVAEGIDLTGRRGRGPGRLGQLQRPTASPPTL